MVHKLSSVTRQHVANQCKLTFSEYCGPETLISDNGLCYTADTNHITSLPLYLQSNGLCLHMMYILGKMLCIKMLQASSGIQPLLPAYVHSQEVTI